MHGVEVEPDRLAGAAAFARDAVDHVEVLVLFAIGPLHRPTAEEGFVSGVQEVESRCCCLDLSVAMRGRTKGCGCVVRSRKTSLAKSKKHIKEREWVVEEEERRKRGGGGASCGSESER
jgi:hypothetical protein